MRPVKKPGPPLAFSRGGTPDNNGNVRQLIFTLHVASRTRRLIWRCVDSADVKHLAPFEVERDLPQLFYRRSVATFIVTDDELRGVLRNHRVLLDQLSDDVRDAIAARVMVMEDA